MSNKKVIAVVGSTGAQGGALVQAILAEGDKSQFKVRALTRNASSDKAQELKKLGVEVVEADINDTENLTKAVQGAYGLFGVTFFWDHHSPEKEKANAKSIADAARKAGIQHVIWSTLEDTRILLPADGKTMPVIDGNYNVPHCDSKGEADQYFADLPVTYLLTSFYWDNFISFGMGPKKGPDGNLYLTIPMGKKKLPGVAVEDIGKCALGVFKHPELYLKKRVGAAGEHLTITEFAQKMSKALNLDIKYNEVSFDAYRAFGFPGAVDIGNMLQFKHDFNEAFCKARNVDECRKLNPALLTFDQWLAKNGSRIPIDK